MSKCKMLLRHKLYEKYTMEEIVRMIAIETNSKKHDEMAHAINLHLIDKKKANGTYEESSGYSGRQTNKR